MKAYDTDLEMRVLRSALGSAKKLNQLRRLGGENLFHYTAAKELFVRANKILKKSGEIPTWNELMHDPVVPESVREIMPETGKPIKKIEIFNKRVSQLEQFARIRYGMDAALRVSELLKEESVDPDDLADILAKGANLSRKVVEEDVFRHYGMNDNRTGKDVLKNLKKIMKNGFLSTGFNSYDNRSRGLPKPSLVVLASESGGGKTKMAGQLQYNMSMKGNRVARWSLEMEHDEMELRFISQITRIKMEKLLRPDDLSKKEQRLIVKCYDDYREKMQGMRNSMTYAVPKGDVTMQDLLDQSEPYRFDCVIIDYLSLLGDASEESQWRALSEASRLGKRWGASNNATVIILAQLKEDETLKAAKYVKDHANVMWCVPAGTLVDTPTGLTSIEKLVDDPSKDHLNISIPIVSDGKDAFAVNFVNSGIQKTYTLTTDRGSTLEATANEQVKVLTREFKIEWKRLDKLQPGDFIATSKLRNPTKVPLLPKYKNIEPCQSSEAMRVNGRSRFYHPQEIKLPKAVTKEFSRLVGYILTDGSLGEKFMTFTSQDKELLDDYEVCFDKTFGFCPNAPSSIKGSKASNVQTQNRNAISFMRSIEGMCGGAHKKYIPDLIMQSPNNILSECLGAMIACDGSVRKDRVSYFTVSKKMAQRFHLGLRRLGVNAVVRPRKAAGSEYNLVKKSNAPVIEVCVSGVENLEKLSKAMDIKLTRKSVSAPKTNRRWMTPLPHLSTELIRRGLVPQATGNGLTQRFEGSGSGIYNKICRKSELDTALEAKLELVEKNKQYLRSVAPDLFDTYEEVIRCGYVFERYVGKKYSGKKKVYDISVPGNHTFVADGFVVHNTWRFTELEELTRILHIRQQKSRNQPMYDFYLKDDTDYMTIRDPTKEEMEEYNKLAGSQSRGQRKLDDYEKFKQKRR